MKIKDFLASSKNRLRILLVLVVLTVILMLTIIFKGGRPDEDQIPYEKKTYNDHENIIKDPEKELDVYIDSVLYSFGIKKEWISTDRSPSAKKKASWFTKNVFIPKDLTSVDVNLDLSSLITGARLRSKVDEDIITKDITISVNDPDTAKTLPAAIIQINHSDKVKRESGIISIVLDRISVFSTDEIDKLILTKNEFSYIFPRNLDEIEIQHKLIQHKKDVVINLTIGGEENYEADFNTSMDDKAISEKVRNFTADFSSINKVILTKVISDGSSNKIQNKITAALTKYNITVISDSMITNAYNGNDKDKLGSFFNNVLQKAALKKYVIAVLPADKADFEDFYNRVIVYRKLGHKFVNLTDYLEYARDEQKEASEREEKLKQEQVKKRTQEDIRKKKKKEDVKVPPQKDVKKKTDKKKK